MKALFDTILARVPAPADDDVEGTLQLQLHALDYSSYVGRIGVGKMRRGRLVPAQEVAVMLGDRPLGKAKVNQVLGFAGLERVPLKEALAGDIVLVTGIDELAIGATIADADRPEGLPPLKVDEPTLTMQFLVNTSPFAGTEGKYVTSRNLRERLQRELLTNMALRVEETAETDVFVVHGRGELHLTILVENMRREGYELAVGRPRVINRVVDGATCEPYEALTVDVEETHQGAVMEALGTRRGDLTDMQPDGRGRVRIDYRIPARGLIGFQNEFMNLTRGTGIMTHVFDEYGPVKGEIPGRRNGVLVSQEIGAAVAFALFNLQERGRLFVSPGEKVYEGMVVGINSRANDLTVNPIKEKKLTNIRAAGKDDNVLLTPPVKLTLEYAVEFIADDELVEVTPQSIRIRKRFLKAHERKRAEKTGTEA
jgi:GTP-binding protein